MSQRLAGPYSPDRVQITIGDPVLFGLGAAAQLALPLPDGLAVPHTIDGRNSDSFLTVARAVVVNTEMVGADGEVIPIQSKNAVGMFNITLLDSSVSNVVLSAMLTVWESGVRFFFPVTVIDLDSAGTLFEGEQCWIEGWPEAAYGAAPGPRAWVIKAAKLTMFHGGRGLPI
jgi:hypothetical protein